MEQLQAAEEALTDYCAPLPLAALSTALSGSIAAHDARAAAARAAFDAALEAGDGAAAAVQRLELVDAFEGLGEQLEGVECRALFCGDGGADCVRLVRLARATLLARLSEAPAALHGYFASPMWVADPPQQSAAGARVASATGPSIPDDLSSCARSSVSTGSAPLQPVPRVLSSTVAVGASAAGQPAGGLPPKAARAPATGKACSELESAAALALAPLHAALASRLRS